MNTVDERTSVLDTSTLWKIAHQLWAARTRLSLRTGGNIPSTTQFAIALRMFVAERDRQRLENIPSSPQRESFPAVEESPESGEDMSHPPGINGNISEQRNVQTLLHYSSIAFAAYANSENEIHHHLESMRGDSVLEAKWFSEKWRPGYFICRDMEMDCIVLSVRGSKEVSDFITNLCAETEPFLNGNGHQGIIKSAYNLQSAVRSRLASYVEIFKPKNGIVLVGHSLGGAVAAALAMILRSGSSENEFDQESEFARALFRSVSCFSFAPPPFINEDLAVESRTMNITTIVNGLDIVPRLSASSLDRLLLLVSRYDWNSDVGESMGRAMETATTGILGRQGARSLSSAIAQNGISSVTMASKLIGGGAREALRNSQVASSGFWRAALNATVFATSLIESQLSNPQQNSNEEADYSFAAQLGMSARDVEQSVIEEPPVEMLLAGVIYHLEKPFTAPNEVSETLASIIVERDARYFADVEASGWMIHDHHMNVLQSALMTLL